MNYQNYKKSRNLTWQILLNENVRELPVRTGSLCRQMKIEVINYSADDEDGKSTIINGAPKIFINKIRPISRQRFTVAHELGHILLGHVGKYELVNREPSNTDNIIEQEANVFASRLLAPACVLWGCNVRNAAQIVKLCDISLQSAQYRMKRLDELYQRKAFLTSYLEKQVFEQFRTFINYNRL